MKEYCKLWYDPDIEIVICKYKENVDWVKYLKFPYIIYDKSKNIPNIWRENYIYLKHIIDNWDNLKEYTIFMQWNPFDHCPDILTRIDTKSKIFESLYKWYSKTKYSDDWNWYPTHVWLNIKDKFKQLFNNEPPKHYSFWSWQAMSVHISRIKFRDKEFYKKCLNKILEENREWWLVNWTKDWWERWFERLWHIIFDWYTK